MKILTHTALLLFSALVLCAFTHLPQSPRLRETEMQSKPLSRPSISLYVEPNFKGRVVRVKAPVEIPNAAAFQQLGIKNDALMSIKIPPGVEVTLFDNGNFLGESLVLKEGDHSDLGRLSHRVSSLKAVLLDHAP